MHLPHDIKSLFESGYGVHRLGEWLTVDGIGGLVSRVCVSGGKLVRTPGVIRS